MRTAIIILLLLVIVLPITFILVRSATPIVDLSSPVTVLGQATPITIKVSDPHGVRSVTASLEQNGARYQVWQAAQGSDDANSTWNFTAGVKTTPQLRDGKAKLILEATRATCCEKPAAWNAT